MRSYSHTKEKPYVVISGGINRERGKIPKTAPQYVIYKRLRDEYKIKPNEIIIEGKSQDTLENFLYSIKKLKNKKINRMKIATNATQYWRFKLFETEAKKEGIINDSFKTNPFILLKHQKNLFMEFWHMLKTI
jgi:uncharacterized SAM-binding protein YcdF (DUF218 family)